MTGFDDPALSYISPGSFSVKTIKRSFSYIILSKGLPKEGTSPNPVADSAGLYNVGKTMQFNDPGEGKH